MVIATLPVNTVRNVVGAIVAALASVAGAVCEYGESVCQSDATIAMLIPRWDG